MKLKVENFGPIRKADIELGQMTVFVGPSNTGKSYLAILIYSIMKAFSGHVGGGRVLHYHAASYCIEKMRHELQKAKWYRDQKIVSQLLDGLFDHWARSCIKAWEFQVARCFGQAGYETISGSDSLVVKVSDVQRNFAIALHTSAKEKENRQENKLSARYKKELFEWMQKKNKKEEKDDAGYRLNQMFEEQEHFFQMETAVRADPIGDNSKDAAQDSIVEDSIVEIANRNIIEFLARAVYERLFALLVHSEHAAQARQSQSHYLPAVRGGVMQSHRTLVSALIHGASRAGLRDISAIPAFTGVLSDFMDNLLQITDDTARRGIRVGGAYRPRISRGMTRHRAIATIGGDVEAKIMRGKIDVQMSDLKYPDFRYVFESGGQKYNLPLMSSSSMVSELAPVSLFIRHYIAQGDLFIVEEPEAHLHPAAQRNICDILVQLVNAGVHVLITTHSDTILEQLGNSIFASKVTAKIAKQKLTEEKSAVYGFPGQKNGKRGTMVKKIPFDKETGILTKDHLDVSSDLYNESVDLFNAGESARGKNKKK